MSKKPNLAATLVNAGGGTRAKPAASPAAPAEEPQPVPRKASAAQQGRAGTKPITVHFPKEVRDQLKILAVEQGMTLHVLIAQAFNDLFAKHSKPEIAPLEQKG